MQQEEEEEEEEELGSPSAAPAAVRSQAKPSQLREGGRKICNE
jgi:hypothetical protein